MIGNRMEYIQAYTELNCLLKYFPKEYIKKLPEKLLDLINKNTKEEFKIDIDYYEDLNNISLSDKTYSLLSVLKYNYWSTAEEKEIIEKKLNDNEKAFQKELREKYNTDNLFKKKEQIIEEPIDANLSMVQYKESILKKIINKLRNLFNRN